MAMGCGVVPTCVAGVGGFLVGKGGAHLTNSIEAYATGDQSRAVSEADKARDSFTGGALFLAGARTDAMPAAKRPGSGLTRQTTEQLRKSRLSLEKLVREHRQKLADYKRDPFAFDNKGTLRNAPEELRSKIIEGRINALKKQISKQEGELQKVNDLLGGGQ